MYKSYEGKLTAKGQKTAIIVSRFNDLVTEELLRGALDCLRRHEADDENIHVVRVPGAYEIPAVASKLVNADKFDSVICLGAVIRGDTPHFDMVANEVAKGVAKVGLEGKIPVIFGVLTTDTIEQALERAGTKAGNKGWDAAISAMEMVNLYSEIDE
ncbi:MAG: 6,7-dimethyl-8-ribityllumazine synthase [Candidatus Marinimicrobia bacterium]|nr:6,7-dimethyl-8-ribityllumazine synthase [Candidatus Neomarinimicrobiota bacterium]